MKAVYRNILFMATVALLMAAGVHFTQEFRFYNIESNELFLYDWSYVRDMICQTGGVATLLGSFLTQFFRIPFAGTVIVSAVYILIAWLMGRVLSRLSGSNVMKGISFLPVAFLFLCMENDYYRFQGHVAFALMLTAVLAYASIRKDGFGRYVFGAVMIPVLFHAAGSVAVVFVASIMIQELHDKGIKGLLSAIYPLIFCLVAALYVRASMVESWEHALTPFMYYDWPSTYFFPVYAWSVVPLLLIVAWIAGRVRLKPSVINSSVVLGLALSFFLAGNFYSKVHSRNYYRMIQEQYWAENGDWDRIIETADRRQPTFLISYLNLALAQKGQLVQNFRYYNPQDLSSLMYPTPNLKTGLSLQSNVYLAWGYLGSGRKAAFDGNVVTPGSRHPRQLQALIQANLVLESYGVAEKYIRILEKTLFYRKWALSMRRFIDNPEAVRSDETLGRMYSSLPLTDEYARYDGMSGDMRDMMEANPSNHILAQFHELYKILEEAQR